MSSSSLSETFTHQRNERTCSAHVTAKLFVQNFFQFFNPTPVGNELYVENECNQYVDFDVFDKDISDLSRDRCSPGGYDRILQFLYVYHLIEDRVGKGNPSIFNIQESVFQDIFAEKIPTFFKSSPHLPHLVQMVKRVNSAYTESKMVYVTRFFNEFDTYLKNERISDLVLDMIKLMIAKRLYVYVGLKTLISGLNDVHTLHAVHVVNVIGREIVIKNSWGDNRTYQTKVNGVLWLKETIPYKIEALYFLFPNRTSEDVVRHEFARRWNNEGMFAYLETVRTQIEKTPELRSIKNLFTKPRIFLRGDIVQINGMLGIFLTYVDKNRSNVFFGQKRYSVEHDKLGLPVMTEDIWRQALVMIENVVENDRREKEELTKLIESKTSDIQKYAMIEKSMESERYHIEGHESQIQKNEEKIIRETNVAETKPDKAEKARGEIERLKQLIVKAKDHIEKNKQKIENFQKRLDSMKNWKDTTMEEMNLARVERNLELSEASLERVKQKNMQQYVPKRKETEKRPVAGPSVENSNEAPTAFKQRVILQPEVEEKKRELIRNLIELNWSETDIRENIAFIENNPEDYVYANDSDSEGVHQMANYAKALLKSQRQLERVATQRPEPTPTSLLSDGGTRKKRTRRRKTRFCKKAVVFLYDKS